MTALNIRSWADVRAWLYVAWPVLSSLLVAHGVFSTDDAALWGGLVTAVLGPLTAFVMARSVSTFRSAFYAVLGAAQAIVLAYGLLSDAQVSSWVAIVNAVLGLVIGGVAAANTDTTADTTAASSADAAE